MTRFIALSTTAALLAGAAVAGNGALERSYADATPDLPETLAQAASADEIPLNESGFLFDFDDDDEDGDEDAVNDDEDNRRDDDKGERDRDNGSASGEENGERDENGRRKQDDDRDEGK
ncbi:MAG: hypothetical protein ACE369_11325 [Roseovarius sp.]